MAWRGEQDAIGNRAPNQALGYDRMGRHLGRLGGDVMEDTSTLAQGIGRTDQPGGGWHPTVLYLLALVIAEMFVFGLIARLLR